MKKILFLLLLISSVSSAQISQPNTFGQFQQFGSPTTWSRINGALYAFSGFVNSEYADTTAANLSNIRLSPGAQIRTGNKLWMRNSTATLWIEFTTGASGWSLTGVSGTTAGTNFVGTTDAQDVVFKRNSIEGMRLISGGTKVTTSFNGQMYQVYTDQPSNTFRDAFYSAYTSDSAGYNIHAVRTGNDQGGAIGAANNGTGTGSAIVANRYNTGSGDGITSVRLGSGNGHAIIGTHAGSGQGSGVVGIITGGNSGDAIHGLISSGTGYSGQFKGGAGVRIERNPVAFGGVYNNLILGNSDVPLNDYSLRFGSYLDGSGYGQKITEYYNNTATSFINFRQSFSLDFGSGANTTLSLNSSTYQATFSNAVQLNTAPTTSAGGYDILTRNTTSGIVEKVLSTTFAPSTEPLAWRLLGNSGTTAGTNFVGTTDGQDVVFKRNSTEVMRLGAGISSTPLVLINSVTAPSSQIKVTANGLGAFSVTNFAADNVFVGFDSYYNESIGHIATNASAALVWKLGGNLVFFGNTGLTVGSGFSATEKMRMELSTGNFGFGVVTPLPAKLNVLSAQSVTTNDLMFTFDNISEYRNGIANIFSTVPADNKMTFRVCDGTTTGQVSVLDLRGDGNAYFYGRVGFGGTTSSFPAITRNGTGVDIKLADNSAYANLGVLNLTLNTAGSKITIPTGTNASAGTSGAMTAGTITISTTAVTASSIIMLTPIGAGTGSISLGTVTAGTSFVINSSDGADIRAVQWWIIN